MRKHKLSQHVQMHRYQDDNTVMATQDYIVLTSPMLKIEYRVDKSAFMTAYKKNKWICVLSEQSKAVSQMFTGDLITFRSHLPRGNKRMCLVNSITVT